MALDVLVQMSPSHLQPFQVLLWTWSAKDAFCAVPITLRGLVDDILLCAICPKPGSRSDRDQGRLLTLLLS